MLVNLSSLNGDRFFFFLDVDFLSPLSLCNFVSHERVGHDERAAGAGGAGSAAGDPAPHDAGDRAPAEHGAARGQDRGAVGGRGGGGGHARLVDGEGDGSLQGSHHQRNEKWLIV